MSVEILQLELAQAHHLHQQVRHAGDKVHQQRELFNTFLNTTLVGLDDALQASENALLAAMHDAQDRIQRLESILENTNQNGDSTP